MTTLVSAVVTLIIVGTIFWLINTRIPMAESLKRILKVVLALILIGTALGLINTYIPMAGIIKAILNIVVVVAACVWVLKAVGLWNDVDRLWSNFRNHRIVS